MTVVRNRRDLEEQVARGKPFHYLVFSDAPMAEHDGKYNYLSQWYGAPFRTEGTLFKTVEHFLVAEKARLFKDLPSALKAIMAKTPEKAHKTGQAIQGVSEQLWAEYCIDFLVKGNFHKFSAHEGLADHLLKTGSSVLVYANPNDSILGVGLAEDHEALADPSQWQGENLLGFALMTVREMLVDRSVLVH